MTLTPGQILENRYRIAKLLGQGGFGAVYRAWDIKLNGPCAVKESFETSAVAQKQFAREASLLFNLRHPNLPRVFDSFVIPGQGLYLVMDFVEGQDLQEMMDGQPQGLPLPEAQVLPWIMQVCDALSYLHSRTPPIIHRDIKPANVRITSEGQAILVDFGIAKLYNPNLRTTAGARAVTPGYSPHEQYGMGATDARSDIYSLGATLYTLLTGQQPVESIQRVARDPLIPAAQLNPSISPAVAAAIGRALCVDPRRRFQSAVEFKAALTALTIDHGRRTMVEPTRDEGRGMTIGPTGTAAVPTPPVLPTPVVPTAWAPAPMMPAVIEPAAAKPALPAWAWMGAIGAFAMIVLICVLVGAALWKWLGPQTASTALLTETAPPTQAVTLTPTPAGSGPLMTDEKGVKMALIPAGEFQMGSEIGDDDEKPVHTVYLDAYYIDVYELTNAFYAACVSAAACAPPTDITSKTRSSYYGNPEYANFPVIHVTWPMAQAYCQWRGGSLPTEAQWEKAARGGQVGAVYPWGYEIPTCTLGANNGANYWLCSPEDTIAVGSFGPNGYGLYDMAGNAWEWVIDWYLDTFYNASPARNPTGPESGEYRVLRGGGYFLDTHYLRAADRVRSEPATTSELYGFRCVRPR